MGSGLRAEVFAIFSRRFVIFVVQTSPSRRFVAQDDLADDPPSMLSQINGRRRRRIQGGSRRPPLYPATLAVDNRPHHAG